MSKAQLQYVERYAEAAMDQMKRYGIPASVILAQGIIESASGASELSRKGNNHFGIKATSAWLEEGGRYLVYDDDKADEKFCAYDSVADSYEHHSRFLVENRRYASLFNLSPDDYEGWAEGLQKAHYASSASYADTIKAVIRNNGLDRYDRMAMAEMRDPGKVMSANTGRDVTQEDTRGSYSFPLAARDFLLVTSPFGMRKDPMDPGRQQMHKGIDIRADHARLFATEDDGRIVSVNNNANTGGGKSVTAIYSLGIGIIKYCMKRYDMIIINQENVIETEKDLNLFLSFIDGEVFDDNSAKITKAISEYLIDVFDRVKRINISVHNQISEDLNAYAIVDFELTANFMETEVQLFSKNEDFKVKERDKIIFDGIVNLQFNGLKSLWDRFCELDIE